MAKHESPKANSAPPASGATPDDMPRMNWAVRAVLRVVSWATRTRLRLAIASIVALATMSCMFAAWSYLGRLAVEAIEPATIELALEAFDAGRLDEAKSVIGDMKEQAASPDLLGGAMFVLGAVKAQEAQSEASLDRRAAGFQVAAKYLEKARSLGVPAGRQGQAAYLLGASLVGGGGPQPSIHVLEEALADPKQPQTKIHALLVRAILKTPNPDLQKALAHNQFVISDPELVGPPRDQAWLERAETLIRLGQSQEALVAIAQASPGGELEAKRTLLLGRLKMAQAAVPTVTPDEQKALLEAAKRHLEDAQQLDGGNGVLAREALYWLGKCEEQAGRSAEAIGHFNRLTKLYGDTPEGLAAMMAEADHARSHGQEEQALAGYRAVLQAVGNPTTYDNPLLPLTDLRERLTAAYAQFVAAQQFAEALALVDLFSPVFGRVECMQLRAKTHQQWGATRRDQATREKSEQIAALRTEGRSHFRAAGRAYEDLARMRYATRLFPTDLWTAADCYFQGQSYTSASRLLEEYLHHESRTWNALALVRLGQAQLARGEFDDSVAALEDCIDIYPEDAVVYQARLECARAYLQLGKANDAEKLLKINLSSQALTPQSPEWRDSKFVLGQLLYESARYAEAIEQLDEAVKRYPDNESALLAKYTIARAYHNAADEITKELRVPKAENETQTVRLRRALDESLRNAHATYLEVQKQITLEGSGDLDPLTRTLLRNCYMMQGSVLFELRRFEEARQAYQNVIALYQNDPVVLEGFVQVANCWRRLDQPVMARGNLKQAKMVLDKLPPEANFLASTNFNRQQWSLLLEEMSKW